MDVSVHAVKLFKSCRRQYQLKYIDNLEPVFSSEAIETGKKYHSYIDDYYKGVQIEPDFSKEYAMFVAFHKYIAPMLNPISTEEKFVYQLTKTHKLHGIFDSVEMNCLGEHKTTGEYDFEKYEYLLGFDEQIPFYMLASGKRVIKYDVIRKPTIRQKQNESDEEFFERMVSWYDEDTESKIRVIDVRRTDNEIKEYRQSLISIIREMSKAHKGDIYYRNTCACTMYNRMCDYATICLNYDPTQPNVNFSPRERIDFSNVKGNKQNGIAENW